jgi:Zn finger protein HypA/HybF involved in hydrogenase expression
MKDKLKDEQTEKAAGGVSEIPEIKDTRMKCEACGSAFMFAHKCTTPVCPNCMRKHRNVIVK